jgi:hypothetical protein
MSCIEARFPDVDNYRIVPLSDHGRAASERSVRVEGMEIVGVGCTNRISVGINDRID